MSGPGRFIVMEGLDGSGTTTQLHLVAEWLRRQGHPVVETFEPSDGPVGKLLRRVIQGEIAMPDKATALLFSADRTWHLFDGVAGIAPSLRSGQWVVCDRYVFSSLAYQARGGIDPFWLRVINEPANDVEPDVSIFIDTNVATCLERIRQRRGPLPADEDDLYHDEAELERVFANYRALIGEGGFTGHLVVVNGNASEDAVFAEIRDALIEWFRLPHARNAPDLKSKRADQ